MDELKLPGRPEAALTEMENRDGAFFTRDALVFIGFGSVACPAR